MSLPAIAAEPLLTWNGSPEIFSLGPLTIRWYGVLFATGFAIGFLLVRRAFLRENKPIEDLDRLLVVLIVSTIVGARLGHCFFYHPEYYLSNPLRIFEVWKGGLASHGGGIGVLTGMWLYSRRRPDQPFLWILDRIAPPVALTGALIRLGNFFNSEIIGVPTDVPWGIVFARIDDAARHPAMLYESLSYFTIFVLLITLDRRKWNTWPSGRLVGLFFMLVFSARFLIEFVKIRQADFSESLPLRMGQLLSIAPVLLGLALFLLAKGRPGGTETPNEKAA